MTLSSRLLYDLLGMECEFYSGELTKSAEYDVDDLGETNFKIGNRSFKRKDFEVQAMVEK